MIGTIEIFGHALTHQKITPGNTLTSVGSEFYQYTERTIAYTSGGTYEIVAGDWIVGATSGAKAVVVSLTLTSGTWAGGDAAGVLTIRSQHGTFQAENLNVAANGNVATVAGNSSVRTDTYPYKGQLATVALVVVSDNTALIDYSGDKPNQTALMGIPLPANSSIILKTFDDIRNLKVIDRVSASACVVDIKFYFSFR